jgi:hypothetical protein
MTNTQKYIVVALVMAVCFGCVAGIALLGRAAAPDASTIVVSGWHRSDDRDPPALRPFFGAWIEGGRLDGRFMVRYGVVYWEYAPTLRPPVGMCYGPEPPMWWIEAPGAAE